MSIQDWFPLGLTGLILLSRGLSRVFSSTIIQKHQFFSTQRSLCSNSHICTWLLEKPWKGKSLNHVRLFATPWTHPWNSPGQDTGVGSLSRLQRIFATQVSNPGIPHCKWILYQLSHKGSPRTLEWIAYSFSRGSPWCRNRTRVSHIAGGFFTTWAIREIHSFD